MTVHHNKDDPKGNKHPKRAREQIIVSSPSVKLAGSLLIKERIGAGMPFKTMGQDKMVAKEIYLSLK